MGLGVSVGEGVGVGVGDGVGDVGEGDGVGDVLGVPDGSGAPVVLGGAGVDPVAPPDVCFAPFPPTATPATDVAAPAASGESRKLGLAAELALGDALEGDAAAAVRVAADGSPPPPTPQAVTAAAATAAQASPIAVMPRRRPRRREAGIVAGPSAPRVRTAAGFAKPAGVGAAARAGAVKGAAAGAVRPALVREAAGVANAWSPAADSAARSSRAEG